MPSEINVGGGGFSTIKSSGMLDIPSGATGDILEITAPPGRVVRLDSLGTTNDQAGISVISDGETVIDSLVLSSTVATVGEFYISQNVGMAGSTLTSNLAGVVSDVVGKSIKVTKSGATTVAIKFSYSESKQ